MNKNNRNFLTWVVIFTLMFVLINSLSINQNNKNELEFSSLLDQIESGNVLSVVIDNDTLTGSLKTGQEFYTNLPYYPDLIKDLKDADVAIKVSKDSSVKNSLMSALISWLPLIVIICVWIYLLKKVGKGSGNPLSFAKSKAKMLMDKDVKIKFKDVAGIDEAREELSEIVDFLRDPVKFNKLGGKIRKVVY